MNLVQLILGVALLVCLGMGIAVFVKALSEKQGQKAVLQFAVIEASLFLLILLILLFSFKSDASFVAYVFMALIYTLLANIPLGIIALIIRAFRK